MKRTFLTLFFWALAAVTPLLGFPNLLYLSQFPSHVSERDRAAVVVVSRCCGPDLPIATIDFITADGTATAGTDYTAVTTNLVFAVGQTNRLVEIPLLDDAQFEPEKTFTITLQNAVGATLDRTNTATIHILDDERGFSFYGVHQFAFETDPYAEIFVQRSGSALPTATVELSTRDITAQSGFDYVSLKTNLVFAVGQTNASVRIPLFSDDVIEGDETFSVELKNATGFPLDATNTLLTVHLQEIVSGFRFGGSNPVIEPEQDGTWLIPVERDGSLLPAATVIVATVDGTAHAGADYLAFTNTLTFAPGQTVQNVPVQIFGDLLVEGDEFFTLRLLTPSGFPLNSSGATVQFRIVDDERGFNLGGSDSYWPENQGSFSIQVSRQGSNLGAATVELATVDGSAKAGLDYVAVSTNLVFRAGQTLQTVEIRLLNDGLIEGDESFSVQLRNASGFPLADNFTTQTIHILDNDLGFVVRGASPDFGIVFENQPFARFEVALVGDFVLTNNVSVSIATQDVDAKAGGDYVFSTSRLAFAPGERLKSFAVPILNNATAEGDRTFRVHLTQGTGLPISGQSVVEATIRDNELGYRLGGVAAGQFQPVFIFREGEPGSVTVWRDGDYNTTSSVNLRLVALDANLGEGMATLEADFPDTNFIVNFGPGETNHTVMFKIPDDGISEPEELFSLALESGEGGLPVQQDSARAYILDAGVVPALVDPDFDLKTPLSKNMSFYGRTRPLVAVSPDGAIYYVGDRGGYDGNRGWMILRTLPSGAPDPAWNPVFTSNEIRAIGVDAEGRLVVAQLAYGLEDIPEKQLFRLRTDGSRDASFAPLTEGEDPDWLTIYHDGRVLLFNAGGSIRRFLPEGQKDPDFVPEMEGLNINGVDLDAAENILIVSSDTILRMRPDGKIDQTFIAPVDPENGDPYTNFRAVLVVTEGKLLVCALAPSSGVWKIIRLLSDGTLDPAFPVEPSAYWSQILRAVDGTPWVFRRTSAYEDSLGWLLERRLPDGGRDFNRPAQQVAPYFIRRIFGLYSIPQGVLLPDGNLLLANSAMVNGQPRHGLTKLLVNSAQRIVVEKASARIPENAGNATMQLLRSGPITNGWNVEWTLEPVSAVPGVDYIPASGVIIFPKGERTASIPVSVLDNVIPDRDRLVRLRFTSSSEGPIPPAAGFAIANDDLGFPPDGTRLLRDGSLLLLPTGWLENRTNAYPWLELGRNSTLPWDSRLNIGVLNFQEPFPDIILTPDQFESPSFFRITVPQF